MECILLKEFRFGKQLKLCIIYKDYRFHGSKSKVRKNIFSIFIVIRQDI